MGTRTRQVSFAKEVFHSGTSEDDGNWVPVTPDRTGAYEDNDKLDAFTSSGSWEDMLSNLDTKIEIDPADLLFKYKLKRQQYSPFKEVWRALLWDIDVVVKKFHSGRQKQTICPVFKKQIASLKSLRHPNCVLFIGFTNPPEISLVMEYMARGSIRDILDNKNGLRFTGAQFYSVALSVARGLNYLHTLASPIVHGNLTSENILCQDNWEVKVSGYEINLLDALKNNSTKGNIPWRAPELPLDELPTDPKSDVYSYGIILWELVTSSIPHSSWKDEKKLFKAIQNGLRPEIPSNCSPLFKELMESCWSKDPNNRPTFHQIIKKLKPFEEISIRMSKQLLMPSFTYQDFYERLRDMQICSELYSLRNDQTLCVKWTLFLSLSKKEEILSIIMQDIESSLYSEKSDGDILLVDEKGHLVWLTNFKNREHLQNLEAIQSRAETIYNVSQKLGSPISLELIMIIGSNLQPNPTHAVFLTLSLNNEQREKCLQIYKDFVVPSMEVYPSWCGNILSNERSIGSNTITALFSDIEDLNKMIYHDSHVQALLTHFKIHLVDIPVIKTYEIVSNTLNITSPKKVLVARKKRILSSPSRPSKYNSSPLPVRIERKPTPSEPLQIVPDIGPIVRTERNAISESNIDVRPKTFSKPNIFGETSQSKRWKVIAVEKVKKTIRKGKILDFMKLYNQEQLVLLVLTSSHVVFHPDGTWSQIKDKIRVNIDRSSNIPIKKITKVLRLRLEQDQPLIILETTARKNYAIFGLKEIQEFLECMEELKIPISRHKVAPIDL